MATVNAIARPAFNFGLSNIIADVKAAFARRAEFNRVVRELDGLSDRELADLGIARSMITQIAREHAAQ